MNRYAVATLLSVTLGCASAPPRPRAAPVQATRPVPSDVVDIRGIWQDTRLDPVGAQERGLDVAVVITPLKTRNVPPIYPQSALNAGVTGTVTLECIIEVAGEPSECVVTDGPADLRAAALESVRGWRWQPLMIGGVPKRALVQLTVEFAID